MRYGKLFCLGYLFFSWIAQAQGPLSFSVQADRETLALDESLTLKFKIEGDSALDGLNGDPEYSAPDFVEINTYQSHFMQSVYENGRFIVKNTKQITKVLRPQKTGRLQISSILYRAGGKVYQAPPIWVQVTGAGQGSQIPKGYGGNIGLGGAGKSGTGRNFFVRAEINKNKIYKGEQLIVSYYLYRKAAAFNLEVTKYPVLNGFLREDLDLPIVRQSALNFEPVTLDGSLYQRALLARYASYPLKDGKLPVDSMGLRFSYYPKPSGGGIGEEDYDPFMQFFRQMAPQSIKIQSDPVSVEVLPLPEMPPKLQGTKFSGLVGQFDLMAAMDRLEFKTNEAATLTVRVEGKGSLTQLKEVDLNLPNGVEIYESKSSMQSSKEGVAEKTFEVLLMARTPGDYQVPSIQLMIFDPLTKQYEAKSTKPIAFRVLPGSGSLARASGGAVAPKSSDHQEAVVLPRPLKAEDTSKGDEGHSSIYWRWLYLLGGVVFGLFFILVFYDFQKRKRIQAGNLVEKRNKPKDFDFRVFDRLKQQADSLRTRTQVLELYKELQRIVSAIIGEAFGLDPRALTRSDLKKMIVREGAINTQCWNRLEAFWNFADMVQFASPEGSANAQAAKDNVFKWIDEVRVLTQEIQQASTVTASHFDPSTSG